MNLVVIRNIVLIIFCVFALFGLLIYSINQEIDFQKKRTARLAEECYKEKQEQAKKDSLQAALIQEQIKFYKKQNKK